LSRAKTVSITKENGYSSSTSSTSLLTFIGDSNLASLPHCVPPNTAREGGSEGGAAPGGGGGGEGGRESGRSLKRVSTEGGFPQGHMREGGREDDMGINYIIGTTGGGGGGRGRGGREGARETLVLGRYTDERARGQLAQNLW